MFPNRRYPYLYHTVTPLFFLVHMQSRHTVSDVYKDPCVAVESSVRLQPTCSYLLSLRIGEPDCCAFTCCATAPSQVFCPSCHFIPTLSIFLLYTSGLELVIVLTNSYMISHPLGNPSSLVPICTVIARSLMWVKLLSSSSVIVPSSSLWSYRWVTCCTPNPYLCRNPSKSVVPYLYHQANKSTTLQQLDSSTHPS